MATRRRETYRHGDLRNALIQAGLELTREGGPDAVVIREATRRAGVVPNAAYRHFADRRALLSAVAQAALARLAVMMEAESATLAVDDPARSAVNRIRAMVTGYLRFATTEPGLFRAAFTATDMADTGGEAAAGTGGQTAFQLLGAALDDLVESGALPLERRPYAEYFVWSAVHGLAVLLVDGPLRGLAAPQLDDAVQRVMSSIERGI